MLSDRVRLLAWLAVLAPFVLTGCAESPAPPSAPSPARIASAAPISDDECAAFARSLEASLRQSDVNTFNNHVDWKALVNTTTAGLGMPAQSEAGFHQGLLDSIRSETGFASQIIKQVAAGGSYTFLRIREMNGQKTVLFRMSTDAGLNYHEWLLANNGDNVLATDVYIYLSGELLTTALRRFALPVATQESKSLLQKLTTAESEYVTHLPKVAQMAEQLRQGRHDEVLRVYDTLPPALRQEKNLLLIRHQAASQISEQELLKAIDDFRAHHPADVCLDFLLIDYYALQGEHDKAIQSVDRLDASVGGDTYLDTLRADAVYKSGDTQKAFAIIDNSIAKSPDLIDLYWTSLGLSLLAKDHDRTLRSLRAIEDRFQLDLSGAHTQPQYAEFAQSPQGQEWIQAHPLKQ
jgi:tetratricopeptide (TPR) repeat protein